MPPPLKNDCFAMPPGVDWTPVDAALARLREGVGPVTGREVVALGSALGRVLVEDIAAPRAHPPFTNSAVDGYGYAQGSEPEGGLVLVEGRAAAGAGFDGVVAPGTALRVLTGARLPKGVDTVVLEEDCEVADGRVLFGKGLKYGANTRPAGEDIAQGAHLLPSCRRLTAGDLAMLASVGVAEVPVRARLKVAVLSTGTEIVQPGDVPGPSGIFDANRPMLAALLDGWGYEVVDLGHVPDDRAQVLAALDRGAAEADAVLTTGGASAGDEDHISAALKGAGALNTWRIALKPGRPLALGLWEGTPVFGMPGNPVAAFVCALIFARPALGVLAGGPWAEPEGVMLPAGFEKAKKQGRAEYLRARVRGASVEVFASEGSGRVSGLSWAEGLVVLAHEAGPVARGDLVRFISFSDFGV